LAAVLNAVVLALLLAARYIHSTKLCWGALIIWTCWASGSSVVRIITPALVQFETVWALSTRTVMEPSPVSCL